MTTFKYLQAECVLINHCFELSKDAVIPVHMLQDILKTLENTILENPNDGYQVNIKILYIDIVKALIKHRQANDEIYNSITR